MDAHGWFWVPVEDDSGSRRALLSQLAAASLHLRPYAEGSPGPGLMLIDPLRPPLLEALRAASRNGLERVLVLVREPQRLGSGGAWELLQAGASEVMGWNGEPETTSQIAARLARWQAVDRLMRAPAVREQLIGRSRSWRSLLREVVEIAAFSDAAVLLEGERGTGKERIARLVHALDPRAAKGELVLLDGSTPGPAPPGGEPVGQERGALLPWAAGPDDARSSAGGGTLFLDEVGELSPPLQAQLLRALQERSCRREGAPLRVVSATHRDLEREVEDGRFRRELHRHLTAWVCRIPPLRERPDDILPLAEHFVAASLPEPPPLDDAVREYLLTRDYPGNVRQLEQLVQRMCRRHVGRGRLTVGDLPVEERPRGAAAPDWREGPFSEGVRRGLARGVGLREIGRAAEELAVAAAVEDEQGSLQRAARRLGVTDRALQLRKAKAPLLSLSGST